MSQSDGDRGIYRKYRIQRLGDKTKKHAKCEYFVLDWEHDRFAVPAALAYAAACESVYPTLAAELRVRAEREALRWEGRDAETKRELGGAR